jgi:hypothetical protein
MTTRYIKTENGRAAIRAGNHALKRPARNLLVILDASKTGDEWVAVVHGATGADLQQLIDDGLIRVAEPKLATPSRPRGLGLEGALENWAYTPLYDLLTVQARARLGLVKGYRMVLEIEKCSGVEALRVLALRFVDEVRMVQGDAAARAFCRELGADV